MIVEETIFEENGIRAFVEKDDGKTDSRHECACGRTVCCGKHKGCCHKKKDKIRFIKGKEL